jgi:hypothetical protein
VSSGAYSVEAVLTLRKEVVRDIDWRDSTLVASEVRSEGSGDGGSVGLWWAGPREYVIFVHGFDTRWRQARDEYARFRWWLERLGARGHVLELHWPGDKGPCRFHWFRKKFEYPLLVKVAELCGERLGEWIERQTPSATFVLVGHSLGCRVIARTVEYLRGKDLAGRVRGVCLMAAAVPTSQLDGGRLGPRRGESLWWRSLFSRGDSVLAVVFPFGQLLEGPSAALGLRGGDVTQWTRGGLGDAIEMWDWRGMYYDHGDYWRGGAYSSPTENWTGYEFWRPPISAGIGCHGESARRVAERIGQEPPRWLDEFPALVVRELPVWPPMGT